MAIREPKHVDNHGVFKPDQQVFWESPEMRLIGTALFQDKTHKHIHLFGPRRHGKTTTSGHFLRLAQTLDSAHDMVDLRITEGETAYAILSYLQKPFYTHIQDNPLQPFRQDPNNTEGMLDTLFKMASHVSAKTGKDIYLTIEELDSHITSERGINTVFAFLKHHHDLGQDSPYRLLTSSLYPLPWFYDKPPQFTQEIDHIRIRKLPADYIPALAHAMPQRLKKDRLALATKIWELSGGHGGLIYRLAGAVDYPNNGHSTEDSLEKVTQQIITQGCDAHQLGAETAYIEYLPPGQRKLTLDMWQTLIKNGNQTTICTDELIALHIAISGLSDLNHDGQTIAPPSPLMADTFSDIGQYMDLKEAKTPIFFPKPPKFTTLKP